jgi:hypothetical protein
MDVYRVICVDACLEEANLAQRCEESIIAPLADARSTQSSRISSLPFPDLPLFRTTLLYYPKDGLLLPGAGQPRIDRNTQAASHAQSLTPSNILFVTECTRIVEGPLAPELDVGKSSNQTPPIAN